MTDDNELPLTARGQAVATVFCWLLILTGVVAAVLKLTGMIDCGWEWFLLGPFLLYMAWLLVGWLAALALMVFIVGRALLELMGVVEVKIDPNVAKRIDDLIKRNVADAELARMAKELHENEIDQGRRNNWKIVNRAIVAAFILSVFYFVWTGPGWLKRAFLIVWWVFLGFMLSGSVIRGVLSSRSSPGRGTASKVAPKAPRPQPISAPPPADDLRSL